MSTGSKARKAGQANFEEESASTATKSLTTSIIKDLQEDPRHVLPVYDLIQKRNAAMSSETTDEVLAVVEQHEATCMARFDDSVKIVWLEKKSDLSADDLFTMMKVWHLQTRR